MNYITRILKKRKTKYFLGNVKVSAIIPILNCQKYLRECIDSVLAQTLSEIEVILACDGGRECFEICEEYVKKDKRVSIIKNRGSYGKSVNAGIKKCLGEYVCIIEGDDWCAPDMFEKLYMLAKHHDADVVKGRWYEVIDGKNQYLGQCFGYPDGCFNVFEHLDFLAFTPSIWSAMYRKDFLIGNNILFPRSGVYVDVGFHYKTLIHSKKYILCNDPLYFYRRWPGQSSVGSSKHVYDGVNSEKFFYKRIIKNKDLWKKIREGVINAIMEHLRWNNERLTSPKANKKFRAAARKFISKIDFSGMELSLLSDDRVELLSS